ncbi:MAG TPA: carboxypeptidase regulatory-like domain-containing protein, partial [Vicinamibacterales bacterium]|nr:carboxypeptidase regulatory-like domain-containing protein [Vicinamibacterales bacterium]
MKAVKALAIFACLVLLPTLAFAQASVTGVVKDTSGAVLPGVTVEVASPALIEKTRSAVSDGTGQYRIVDLRPGTYSVTFTLTGFSSVKREGIELTGSFVATVNADMKVGSLEETITVSGQTPIVDVQSVRRQTILSNETLTTVPTARSWAATAVLIPGITIQAGTSADIQITPQMTVFGGAGGRSNEGRMQVDGLNTGAALNGGGVSTYVADISNAQEVVTTTSGGLGEAEVGGPTLSIVPKSGGNTVKGAVYLSGVSSGMVGSNYQKVPGFAVPGVLLSQWDYTGGVGGPIVKDRLWYYGTARDEGQHRTIPGIYPNLNAGDPTKFSYSPDTTRQAQGAESFQLFSIRLTTQITPRNKFNYHQDFQLPCNGAAFGSSGDACRVQKNANEVVGAIGLGGLTATTSPETTQYLGGTLIKNSQFTWSSPVTNRLLLEAGLGSYRAAWGPFEQPGNLTRGLARITEQAALNGAVANLQYRSANWAQDWDNPNTWRASASYVTGAHNFKFGYIGGYLVEDIENHGNDLNLAYTFNNGVPVSVSESLRVFKQSDRVRYDALYAQDQWTMGRITLQGALRFDHAWSFSPPQTIGPALIGGQTFLATPLQFGRTDGVNYKDISPRGGMAWDLFGNGKTAVKINTGRYEDPASNLNNNYSISNPIARIATTATRNFVVPAGGSSVANIMTVPVGVDKIPNCDFTNNLANGACQQSNALTFGTATQTTANIDPALLNGWGIRPNDWQIGASIQQQLAPRVSVEVGYFKRWLQNFTATDNTLVSASDFTPFSITAPLDSRLPNGGGYTVSGLFNQANKFGQTANNITDAGNFGKQYQSYNGFLINFSARAAQGLTVQGGINTGRTVTDNCAVRAVLIEGSLGIASSTAQNTYCHNDPGFITKANAIASYIIPKADVLVAMTFRTDQGAPLQANWNAPSATVVQPALGRP